PEATKPPQPGAACLVSAQDPLPCLQARVVMDLAPVRLERRTRIRVVKDDFSQSADRTVHEHLLMHDGPVETSSARPEETKAPGILCGAPVVTQLSPQEIEGDADPEAGFVDLGLSQS